MSDNSRVVLLRMLFLVAVDVFVDGVEGINDCWGRLCRGVCEFWRVVAADREFRIIIVVLNSSIVTVQLN